MSNSTTQQTSQEQMFCYNHPDRATMLRCNRCERPICVQCATLTPTGYRCKECVRGQQKVFDTAQWIDYPLAVIAGAGLSFLGSIVAQMLGWFVLFIGPIVGIIIAEVIRWAVRRRRSRLLFRVATASVIVGALPLLLLDLIGVLFGGSGGFGLFGLLWPLAYTFLVASSAYYRLSGIQIR